MKNKKARIALQYFLIMLMLGLALFPNMAKANWDSETWLRNYAGYMEDGTARGLIVTKNSDDEVIPYLKLGDSNPSIIYTANDNVTDAALDGYGMVNILCPNNTVIFWSYDLFPDQLSAREYNLVPNANDPKGYMHDIESFVFKGTGKNAVLVGYKSFSGEVYPSPSLDEMKEAAGSDSSIQPRYIPGDGTLIPEETPGVETPKPSSAVIPSTPTPTEKPSESPTMTPTSEPISTEEPSESPAMTPTSKPSPTEKPSESPTPTSTSKPMPSPSLVPPTQAPSVSTSAPLTNPPSVVVQPTATPKVSKKLDFKTSKKKGKTTYSLCEGDKKVIEYTLFNGNLTWKAGKKKGKASGVRYAGFIKKSRNLYYGDKKGRGYTISSKNGKKKLIIKKGAKKPIYSAKFIVKVKVASKPINISNK